MFVQVSFLVKEHIFDIKNTQYHMIPSVFKGQFRFDR